MVKFYCIIIDITSLGFVSFINIYGLIVITGVMEMTPKKIFTFFIIWNLEIDIVRRKQMNWLDLWIKRIINLWVLEIWYNETKR